MLSLIPISDANPTRRLPVVTIGLIVANVLVFLQEPGLGTGSAGASRYFLQNAPAPYMETEFHTWNRGVDWLYNSPIWAWRFGRAIDNHLGFPR